MSTALLGGKLAALEFWWQEFFAFGYYEFSL